MSRSHPLLSNQWTVEKPMIDPLRFKVLINIRFLPIIFILMSSLWFYSWPFSSGVYLAPGQHFPIPKTILAHTVTIDGYQNHVTTTFESKPYQSSIFYGCQLEDSIYFYDKYIDTPKQPPCCIQTSDLDFQSASDLARFTSYYSSVVSTWYPLNSTLYFQKIFFPQHFSINLWVNESTHMFPIYAGISGFSQDNGMELFEQDLKYLLTKPHQFLLPELNSIPPLLQSFTEQPSLNSSLNYYYYNQKPSSFIYLFSSKPVITTMTFYSNITDPQTYYKSLEYSSGHPYFDDPKNQVYLSCVSQGPIRVPLDLSLSSFNPFGPIFPRAIISNPSTSTTIYVILTYHNRFGSPLFIASLLALSIFSIYRLQKKPQATIDQWMSANSTFQKILKRQKSSLFSESEEKDEDISMWRYIVNAMTSNPVYSNNQLFYQRPRFENGTLLLENQYVETDNRGRKMVWTRPNSIPIHKNRAVRETYGKITFSLDDSDSD